MVTQMFHCTRLNVLHHLMLTTRIGGGGERRWGFPFGAFDMVDNPRTEQ